MQQISTTPFGRRMVDAGLLAAQEMAKAPAPQGSIDKYSVHSALVQARAAFGVNDRALAVLSALLSFHPERELEGDSLIVFPSNASLSERAHGMAESSLRRHIAALVHAGLILRHDSPNGKRYAARGASGEFAVAFGFNLRPLLVRAPEIFAAAQAAQDAREALKRLRERVVLKLRDATKLLAFVQEEIAGCHEDLVHHSSALARALRRKLDRADLLELEAGATQLLADVNTLISRVKTEEVNGNAANNERHYQYSNKTLNEFELSEKTEKAEVVELSSNHAQDEEPRIPLGLVLRAAPDIKDYARDGIDSWRDLVVTASFVRGMLGISEDAWSEACRIMGDASAATVVACILQRSELIAKPGGYLRALSAKAANDAFSPGPMVMALLRAENTRAV